jgi:hypothetical protein
VGGQVRCVRNCFLSAGHTPYTVSNLDAKAPGPPASLHLVPAPGCCWLCELSTGSVTHLLPGTGTIWAHLLHTSLLTYVCCNHASLLNQTCVATHIIAETYVCVATHSMLRPQCPVPSTSCNTHSRLHPHLDPVDGSCAATWRFTPLLLLAAGGVLQHVCCKVQPYHLQIQIQIQL